MAAVSTPRAAARKASRSACTMRQGEAGRGSLEVSSRGGGNGQEVLGGVLDQQGEDEVGEQPTAGERFAPRWQAAEAEQPFQPPEREFHLPPEAICRQHLCRRHFGGSEVSSIWWPADRTVSGSNRCRA